MKIVRRGRGAGYEVLARGPFVRSQVRVAFEGGEWQPASAGDESLIEAEWRRRRARAKRSGSPLFNGRLWRLDGFSLRDGGLDLKVGWATYREYVGTRVSRFFTGRERGALANPLAVCAAIITADQRVVVGVREGVDLDEGLYDVPGGMIDHRDGDPFEAVQREINEELGLAIDVQNIVCSGLIYDLVHPHYELCFFAPAGVPFAALTGLHPAERESGPLEGIANSTEALSQFTEAEATRISPTGHGCLMLCSELRR